MKLDNQSANIKLITTRIKFYSGFVVLFFSFFGYVLGNEVVQTVFSKHTTLFAFPLAFIVMGFVFSIVILLNLIKLAILEKRHYLIEQETVAGTDIEQETVDTDKKKLSKLTDIEYISVGLVGASQILMIIYSFINLR